MGTEIQNTKVEFCEYQWDTSFDKKIRTKPRKITILKRFDSKALYEAMNARRLSQGMTWSEISREIGVSASTIQRTKLGGRMEVDGMLAMVNWLGVQVETFVRDTDY